MNRPVNDKEIHYLLAHLDKLYEGVRIETYLSYKVRSEYNSLLIPPSDQALDPGRVVYISEIPVLFPCSDRKHWYSVQGKQILFHHDLLKSAFYLLSGFQEYHASERDAEGRFPWKFSIQYRLGITKIPVVNYYFEVLLEAFEKFCTLNGLNFKKKTGGGPVLFLSHDVDRIKKYSLRNLVYTGMQILRLRPDSSPLSTQVKKLKEHMQGLLSGGKDPYWNFEEMCDLESSLNITSTWFFLEKGSGKNSLYRFRDKKIRALIAYLSGRGHEIGLHATLESSEDQASMNGSVQRLQAVSSSTVRGVRQHFLKYRHPLTPAIQIQAGLEYDASLGFAEQPGFRNSFAHPFRLYDFENQEPMNIWQLPLCVMELTLLQYMNVPPASLPETIRPILSELSRFQGVFSLLWHNCRLDENTHPGIWIVYRNLLEEIMQAGYHSLSGQEILDSLVNAR
ncbi:MAG: polysaccharide deacetylase family protein [Bacteroidales bacterium]|nr:polysaccharide deacetylase family protein [Bacteroidales bacterium]